MRPSRLLVLALAFVTVVGLIALVDASLSQSAEPLRPVILHGYGNETTNKTGNNTGNNTGGSPGQCAIGPPAACAIIGGQQTQINSLQAQNLYLWVLSIGAWFVALGAVAIERLHRKGEDERLREMRLKASNAKVADLFESLVESNFGKNMEDWISKMRKAEPEKEPLLER